MAKMANATFAYQKTGGVNILVNDLHLPCLPHVYSSVFTYLRKYFLGANLRKSLFSSRVSSRSY